MLTSNCRFNVVRRRKRNGRKNQTNSTNSEIHLKYFFKCFLLNETVSLNFALDFEWELFRGFVNGTSISNSIQTIDEIVIAQFIEDI